MKYILIVFTVLLNNALFSQFQNIKIGNFISANEPSVCINPKNTNEMMVGSNLNYWYFSQDAGYTWTSGTLVSPEYGVWGDPVIISDTAGDFYYFHLSNPVSGNWIDRIVCQKFDKQNNSWSPGTYMGLNGNKAQDKHWAAVDKNTNTFYVTWSQFDTYGSSNPNCQSNIRFSKSIDGSETWSDAISINEVSGDCIDGDNTTEGAVPAIGPNGEIYVAWSGPAGIVFDRSLDGGETWLDNDIYVTAQPGGWNLSVPGISRCNGFPITVCDISNGRNHGTIYINYADQSNGNDDADVWLVKSTDGGNNWSEPVRVNNDPPGKQQFFTWMAIDQTNGTLYFVFYDRRNHDDNATDVYMAVSGDGGLTFENFKISETPFTPSASGYFFGDYNNIAAENNTVRPVWTRRESNGSLSLYTAIVDMTVSLPTQPESFVSLEQNSPNPFNDYTIISFRLMKSAKVYLAMYNALGSEIKVLMNNQKMEAGKHEFIFNNDEYNLTPGIYFLELKSENLIINRKMIVAGLSD
jgi:hypothetical protein